MGKFPKVFGTFGVELDPQEFEMYDKSRGCYDINLVPDCRVFIFGVDVTKDVLNVNVQKNINNIGRCHISLTNPRGKYVLSKNDLRKKWREDKDILDAYTLEKFEKQFPKDFMSKVLALAGSSIESTFDYFKDTYSKFNQPVISTRMIYETKFYSGMEKKVGDTVFDYRDPVLVFFKGRFSPYWYFGYSGVITGIDEANSYGESSIISLECQDILHLWDKQHLMIRSSMIPAGRYELSRVDTLNKALVAAKYSGEYGVANQEYNISNIKSLSFNRFIQYCAFGWADLYSVYNNNLILNNIDQKLKDVSSEKLIDKYNSNTEFTLENNNEIDYFLWNWAQSSSGNSDLIATREKIREIYKTCNMYEKSMFQDSYTQLNYMFSQRSFKDKNKAFDIPHPGGSVNGKAVTTLGPNSQRFSSWNLTYMQFVKIAPKVLRTQNEIPKWYEASLRFWEKNPIIPQSEEDIGDSTTGWKDNDYFCVAGSHPAMTYTFLNNFAILPHIYNQVITSLRNASSKFNPLDRLAISPADKIREQIVGSPTEYDVGSNKNVTMTQASFFRPRLFFLAPRRYNSEKSLAAAEFIDMTLIETNTLSSWGVILEACKNVDYNIYASSMGDIHIEPELYDIHPKLFMEPTQYKKFYCEASNIEDPIVAYRSPSSTIYDNVLTDRKGVSWFGERSTHPLTVMAKDVVRDTTTFQASQMATSVKITAALTDMQETNKPDIFGGEALVENAELTAGKNFLYSAIDIFAKTFGMNIDEFRDWTYTADGFDNSINAQVTTSIEDELKAAEHQLKKEIMEFIINSSSGASKKELNFYSMIKELEKVYYDKSFSTKKESDKNTNYIYTQIKSSDNYSKEELEKLLPQDKLTYQTAVAVTKAVHDERLSIILKYDKPTQTSISNLKKERDQLRTNRANLISQAEIPEIARERIDGNIYIIEKDIAELEQKSWDNFDNIIKNPAEGGKTVEEIYYLNLGKLIFKTISPSMYSKYMNISNGKNTKIIITTPKDTKKASTKLVDIFGDSGDLSGVSFYAKLVNSSSAADAELQFSKDRSGGESQSTFHKVLYNEFLNLFRDFILCADGSDKVKQCYESIKALHIKKLNQVQSSNRIPKTLGDLKQFAIQGKYNPKRDLMRLYGYNPAPPKTFLYVTQKGAGRHYAMMYLNKFLGQAFTIQADIVGRPELSLNRPMYMATKDAIGLLDSYTITYASGSSFSSHIGLSFIRKNAFTYDYSLGTHLDTLPEYKGVNQNFKFRDRAEAYYKFAARLKAAKNLATTASGNVVSSQLIESGVSKIYSLISSKDMGLHSFHDDIGQIDLDRRMTEDASDAVENKALLATGQDPYDDAEFRSLVSKIDSALKERETLLFNLVSINKKLEENRSTLNKWSAYEPPAPVPTPLRNTLFIALIDGNTITPDLKLVDSVGGKDFISVKKQSAKTSIVFNNYNNGITADDPLFKNEGLSDIAEFTVNYYIDITIDFSVRSIDKQEKHSILLSGFTKNSKVSDFIEQLITKLGATGLSVVKKTSTVGGKEFIPSIDLEYTKTSEDGVSITVNTSSSLIIQEGGQAYRPLFNEMQLAEGYTSSPEPLLAFNAIVFGTGSISSLYNIMISFKKIQDSTTIVSTRFLDLEGAQTFNDIVIKLNSQYDPNVFPIKASIKSETLQIALDEGFRDITYLNRIASNPIAKPLLSSIDGVIVSSDSTSIAAEARKNKKVTLFKCNVLDTEYKSEVERLKSNLNKASVTLCGLNTYNLYDFEINNIAGTSDDDFAAYLAKWTTAFFESGTTAQGESNLLKLQKFSLFGQLFNKATKISGSRYWKIVLKPELGTGRFNKNPIKKYAQPTDFIPNSKYEETKRFVWTVGTGSSQTSSDVINFIIGRPDEGDNKLIENKKAKDMSDLDAALSIKDSGAQKKALKKCFGKVFAPTSSGEDIVEHQMSKIKQVIDEWWKDPSNKVIILGFTCSLDDPDYNDRLSERRTMYIRALLIHGYVEAGVEKRIPESKIQATGVGENSNYLLNTKNTEDPKNRRVEIYITKPTTMSTAEQYTVWEDWNTPVKVQSLDILTKEYEKEKEGY